MLSKIQNESLAIFLQKLEYFEGNGASLSALNTLCHPFLSFPTPFFSFGFLSHATYILWCMEYLNSNPKNCKKEA